ncbi:MAG TPA: TolC family protein [Bacteroidales bacterium]|jgi:outer membrane protein TolC|nr:TolC family protein [Bacteroidales bacterium]
MKRLIIVLSTVILGSANLLSQDIDRILAGVEKNNTTLVALRKSADAELISNKTGLYPENPEFAFNYLWGSPESIGNRKDISMMQSFDFPSAYAYRNQISEQKNVQVELEYERQLKSIMTQTRLVCNELIYHNALAIELKQRIVNAQKIADSYKSKFEAGETGIIDFNKAQVYLLNIIKDAESCDIERSSHLAELKSLNGGLPVDFNDSIFPLQTLPVDFEQWYADAEKNNPVLRWLNQEISISQKNEKLNAAMGLPKIQAGYMSEDVVGEQFRGVALGLTLPLFENKNAVKYAKAKTFAVQSAETDSRQQFYNNLKALHTKAGSLQNSLNDYRSNLQKFNNSALLQKALDNGELSLAEYYLELTVYYESFNRLLDIEKSLNETVIELFRYQ